MSAAHETEYVTAWIAGQLFGIPIHQVHDVFEIGKITCVPLAQPEVAGVLNLRGRVVTAIDMRRRLGLTQDDKTARIAIGIDYEGEAYGLLVDSMGEVLKLPAASLDANPINMPAGWAQVSNGLHRLEDRLMVVLDIDRVFDLQPDTLAA